MKILRVLAIVLCLMLSVQFSFGNPYITAIPLEDTDYYVVSIDGFEYTVSPSFDMIFLHDLVELADGEHIIKLTPASYDDGEGGSVQFILIKETNPQWIHYTIKKDPNQKKLDSLYDDRFDEPLKIKVENDYINNPPEEERSSSGGSGCN